jgi:DNA (cytosine-5)-methyltransferase 1
VETNDNLTLSEPITMKGKLNELHLFAGAGGGILGGMLLGHTTVCAVEIEPYCREVLLQRQRDGILPKFPIWDDVTTFDGNPWRGKVDVVCGGFPCQDISAAGTGDGLDGERSGLWAEMARIVCEIRPKFTFVENSPVITSRGMGIVLGDLASMGYDARWGVLGANDLGYDHKRDRAWIVANLVSNGLEGRNYSDKERQGESTIRSMARLHQNKVWHDIPAPNAFGMSNGVASRVDRLKAIGNGQVPIVAATAWKILGGE